MKGRKKAQSGAQKVDAAWKRIVAMHKRYSFLPHDPKHIDLDGIRRAADEVRVSIKVADVTQLRMDYGTVQEGLGYIPPLPR